MSAAPGGGDRLFADSGSLVNVIGKGLGFYFVADIPLAPDNPYVSLDRSPYFFSQVEPGTIAPVPTATRAPSNSNVIVKSHRR